MDLVLIQTLEVRLLVYKYFYNSVLFALCTSRFIHCIETYTMACRRVLSSAPL
jgi:hypothetical protein